MIIRTYQRRHRGSDSLRGDSSSQESFWSSSQESAWSSSQEAGFVSSQDLSNWSSLEIEENVPKKRKQQQQEEESFQVEKFEGRATGAKQLNRLQRQVGLSLSRRWGFSAPPNSTLMEAQESGEMMEQVDEVNFAMDGLREGQPLQVQQASLISILSLCASLQQRRFLRSHGIAKTLVDAIVALPTGDPALSLAASAVFYVLASDGHDASVMDSDPCIRFLLKLVTSQTDTVSSSDGMNIVAKVYEKLRATKTSSDAVTTNQLTPKSLALRTLERACLSAVVLDDNSGAVTKVGGQFKERLRELGGLDVVCNVVATCLTNLMKGRTRSDHTVSLLLRCLKVMENVTFLSEENQAYLLRLKHHQNSIFLPESFIGIVIKAIDTLQDISSQDRTAGKEVDSSLEISNTKETITCKDDAIQKQRPALKGRDASKSANQKELKLRNALQKAKIINTQRKASLTSNCQKMIQTKVSDNDRRFKFPSDTSMTTDNASDDIFSQDPYDFDEPDYDIKFQFGKPKHQHKSRVEPLHPTFENHEAGGSSARCKLEEECLLSAVKVLMNLTNDNATGCKQVGACNGIFSVASLLVSNYPRESQEEMSLDLLVTVLGMLVNLVEKDKSNRSQLAALDLKLPSHIASGNGRGILTLLCSLFLSKQGSGEAAEAREKSIIKVEDDDTVQRGQREAENMIVEAYTALLLAFLSTESDRARQAIAERLPGEGLLSLVPVLERFVAFHLSLNMISAEAHAAVQEVINSLKQPAIDL
ncbi:wings apart-like protein homolog isoform X1 [Selaginella moellendorffii]|uniref:wings apart-like protein homolog isoform X1 n=1 Tax=Selaginella moellendorffii TaxID=88036 RepID=UPI000D1C6FCF|nr:wings apart-like protein homolog isoform X1 [Selaginella moellendorffii]|eukprot:XP_024538615.1 wings apart-like protein homolog isoform X1 [Selaginella moellendorffii]